jgi:uncharacterized protein YeaO (DUF488 family)
VSVRIVRLGSPRVAGEGLRIGTVRRPPRGVRREDYARRDYYDVWLPLLAPSAADVRRALDAETAAEWRRFARSYRKAMARPEARHVLETLAALSHQADFSVGCYCADERRCHRSLLREILRDHGARLA